MNTRSDILLLILAAAVAVSPSCAEPHGHCFSLKQGTYEHHHHHHVHDGEAHSHHHHHHPGEQHDDEDHHGHIGDHGPSSLKIVWTAPRGTEVDPPPAHPAPDVWTAPATDWTPGRRAKPPPELVCRVQPLHFITTVILLV